jgi:hypothetical protein
MVVEVWVTCLRGKSRQRDERHGWGRWWDGMGKGTDADADEVEWVCREGSVEDEGRIPNPISNKFVSPVNKETVGVTHLKTPDREAPQMPNAPPMLERPLQHDRNDDLEIQVRFCPIPLLLNSFSSFSTLKSRF